MQELIGKVKKLFAFTDTEKWRNILSWIVAGTFLVYFFCSILVYAIWIPGATFFAYGRTSGKLIRIFISILVVAVGILTYITYRKKINHFWIALFFLLIFFNLLSVFITPSDFFVLYKATNLHPFLTSSTVHISTYEIIIGFLSFSVDILFGFLIFFVYPYSFKKNTFIILLVSFLLIMFYSFVYSFLKEKEFYKYFFSGQWKYQTDSIGSIFGNKQQWGIFLSITPICSLLLIFITRKSTYKKVFKFIFYGFGLGCCALGLLCSLVSFCKTAIICGMLSIICFCVFFVISLFRSKKTRIFAIICFIFIGLVFATITLFCSIPALQSTRIGSFIKNIFDTLISRGEIGVGSRLELVVDVLQNFPSTNLFIGIPKGMLTYYVKGILPELMNGLHTGIVIYFCRVGMFGCGERIANYILQYPAELRGDDLYVDTYGFGGIVKVLLYLAFLAYVLYKVIKMKGEHKGFSILFVVIFILSGMFADNSFVGVSLTFLFAAPFLYTSPFQKQE